MNILFPYMARWRSANWTRYHALFTEFAKRGHNIFVLEPPSLNSSETNFIEMDIKIHKNIKIITVNTPPFWNTRIPYSKIVKKGLYTLNLVKPVEGAIREYNIDILFAYNIPQYYIVKKFKDKVKVVFDVADDFPEMLSHEFPFLRDFIKNISINYMLKLSKLSDVVVTVSSGLKKKFNKSFLIPNGVDLSLLRDNRKIRKTGKIIGFVGSFEYFVDFDLIFYLIKHLKDAKFLLVGSGRLFKYIKEFLEKDKLNNVILTGPIKHENLTNYLSMIDIALIPFKKSELTDNSCPIKLFEYALFQIPIVSRDLKEVKAIGERFVNFYKNKEGALGIIKDILKNPEHYNKKTIEGLKLVKNRYNWATLADEYLNILSQILK